MNNGSKGGERLICSNIERTDSDIPEETVNSLVRNNTDFALNLHRALIDRKPGENLVYSPFSVSVGLAMAWMGSRGTTEAEMQRVLGFLDQDETHRGFNYLSALHVEVAA